MTTLDTFAPARPASTGNFFSTLIGHVISWNDSRVTVKVLSRLTDRELDDIGLTRGDIAAWTHVR